MRQIRQSWRGGGRTRAARPLWVRLVALVVVPMTVLLGVLAVIGHHYDDNAVQAQRVGQLVKALAGLGQAEIALYDESEPVGATSVLVHPELIRQYGLGPDVVSAIQKLYPPATVQRVEQTSDRALAAIPRLPQLRVGLDQVRAQLLSARQAGNMPGIGAVITSFTDYDHAAQTITAVEDAAISDAVSEAVGAGGPALQGRLTEAASFADLAELGSAQPPNVLAALQAPNAPAAVGAGVLIPQWGGYLNIESHLTGLPANLASAYARYRANPTVQFFETELVAVLNHTANVQDFIPIASDSLIRNQALNGLLTMAIANVSHEAVAFHDDSLRRAQLAWLLMVILLLVAAAAVLLIGSSVGRPLRRLADEAGRISEGQLVDVPLSGPREVQVVGRALRGAVDNLRRVETQAEALARGDLDADSLREAVPGPLGAVVHASVERVVSTIREREALQTELAHQAAHDPLTELPNRASALRMTDHALLQGRRSGAETAMLFIDLDYFKEVNDTHGHAAGDEVLRVVAARMLAAVRAEDVVCRLGGDEFVVIIRSVETDSSVVELANRLIERLGAPIEVSGQIVHVGASIGIALSRAGASDASEMLLEADTAVYHAKASGRGVAEVFDEDLRRRHRARSEAEHEIRLGLDRGEFVAYYQPVVSLDGSTVHGFEALVRWHRPGHGVVAPNDFIPVAESSDLVIDIDRCVLEQATCQLVAWTEQGIVRPDVDMAVNISGHHLGHRKVVDDVRAALDQSGLEPHRLILEITETVVVKDPSAIKNLDALKALGVRIALDDFGTGYTSIGQLHELPVDILKIDRSYISAGDRRAELVKLIVEVAHTFNLSVIAEGVEETAQLTGLRTMCCDLAQGFLFARPLPAATMRSWMVDRADAAFEAMLRNPAESLGGPGVVGIITA